MPRRILLIAGGSAVGLDGERTVCPNGCELSLVEDAAAGVQAAIAGGFDLVLVAETASSPEALEVLRQIQGAPSAPPTAILGRNATIAAAVSAMKAGAVDCLEEPICADEFRSVPSRAGLPEPLVSRADGAESRPSGPAEFEGMLGRCPAMQEVFALIRRIAPADSTVLVHGESGTGKEMIVRAIHHLSRRCDHPLLACDCTALAPTLLESELFGHVKGSFSGAIATKQGLFEVADHGTLFLDEVANLSQETQGKLLRVLETRRVRKVGDTAEHDVDIRLIATTNRSLVEMVKAGEFRADLYYRLNVVPVSLPALRDRHGDIPLLARTFLAHFSRQMGVELKGFSREAMRQMELHTWPGNVRELRNIVERLTVLYGGLRIELSNLPWEVREARQTPSAVEVPQTWEEVKRVKRHLIGDLERRFLIAALDRCGRNVTQAAESVGMQRSNFHALLRQYGIKPEPRQDK
jgi:DNA-binding NtrC family response regulator